jgi:hypothetical protein
MEDLLSVPVPDFAPTSLRHPGGGLTPGGDLLSPGVPLSHLSDNAASVWGMAVKTIAERRASAVGHNLQLPKRKSSQASRKKSAVEEELHGGASKSIFGQLTRNMSWGKKKNKVGLNDHESAAKEYQKRFQERVAVKDLVMYSWEAEMAATAQKAKAKSRNIVNKAKPTGPDIRFPATWARYPSHSRHERSTSAGRRDHAESKDFAIAKKTEGEPVWYHGEKRHHLYHHDDDEHYSYDDQKEHLRERVGAKKDRAGDKIKNKKYKLGKIAKQGVSDHAMGQRSSLTSAGRLEFPELEILPITMTTLAQQEQDIHEEESDKVREQRRNFATAAVGDGSLEDDDENEISINDPRFYDDCIAEAEEMFASERKKKFMTWSVRELKEYASGSESTRRGRTLRKSTDDYHYELQIMEKAEREKVLLAAEHAWGEKKRGSF